MNFSARASRSRFKVVAKERRTIDGIVFASGREAKRYAELRLLERAGTIRNIVLQPKFKVRINNHDYCTYTPDFAYDGDNGARIVEEIKSSGTRKDAAYRLRRKAAELYCGITVREVIA